MFFSSSKFNLLKPTLKCLKWYVFVNNATSDNLYCKMYEGRSASSGDGVNVDVF